MLVTSRTEFVRCSVSMWPRKAWVSRALDLGSALAISLAGHDQLEDGRRFSRAGFAEHARGAPSFFGRDAGLVVRARGHLGLDEPGRFDRAARPDGLCRRHRRSRSVPPQDGAPGLGREGGRPCGMPRGRRADPPAMRWVSLVQVRRGGGADRVLRATRSPPRRSGLRRPPPRCAGRCRLHALVRW